MYHEDPAFRTLVFAVGWWHAFGHNLVRLTIQLSAFHSSRATVPGERTHLS